jgi:hypothetical protein
MGFFAPTATSARRSTFPGIPTPVRSASRVSHPLDGFLPSSLPTSRAGATHGVHPSEPSPPAEPSAFRRPCPHAVSGNASSCSEDQEVTLPRSSRALLPARIRTRPGRSPGAGRYSLGLCAPLESVPRPPWGRLPVPFPPALPSTALGESGRTALQGLADDQAGRSLAGRPALSRFSTRTCPRLLPTTVFLSVTRPEVSQPARSIFDLHRTRPPEGSRRALLARLPPTARRPPDSTPLEPPRPGRPTAPPVGSVSDDPKTARADPSGREPQAAGHPNPPPGPSPAIRGPPVPSPESVVGDR